MSIKRSKVKVTRSDSSLSAEATYAVMLTRPQNTQRRSRPSASMPIPKILALRPRPNIPAYLEPANLSARVQEIIYNFYLWSHDRLLAATPPKPLKLHNSYPKSQIYRVSPTYGTSKLQAYSSMQKKVWGQTPPQSTFFSEQKLQSNTIWRRVKLRSSFCWCYHFFGEKGLYVFYSVLFLTPK